jgi:hypothetical protein
VAVRLRAQPLPIAGAVLRALDALHVACAFEWKADLFITSDKRQFKAAINTKLHSEFIGQQ